MSALFFYFFALTLQDFQQTFFLICFCIISFICVLETMHICTFIPLRELAKQVTWSIPIFQSCDLPHKALPCWLCLHLWINVSFFLLSSCCSCSPYRSLSCSPGCHAILSACQGNLAVVFEDFDCFSPILSVFCKLCSYQDIPIQLSGNQYGHLT